MAEVLIFEDNFTEGSDTTLASHTPSPTGTSWTLAATSGGADSSLQVQASSDTVIAETGTTSDGVLYTADETPSSADYFVEAKITTYGTGSDDPHWLGLRYTASSDFYAIRIVNNDIRIYKTVSSSTTLLATRSSGFSTANGDVVRFAVTGDHLKVFLNGVYLFGVIDTSLTSVGKACYAMGQIFVAFDDMNDQAMDDFKVGANEDLFFEDGFFSGGSDTTLASHTPDVGTSWSIVIDVNTSTLKADASNETLLGEVGGANDGVLYTADVSYPGANYRATVHIEDPDSADDPGILAVRVQDSDNLYALLFNSAVFQLYKKTTASGWETLGADQGAVVTDEAVHSVYLEIVGDRLAAGFDGVEQVAVNDTAHTATGKAGMGIGAVIIATDDMSTQEYSYFEIENLISSAIFTIDAIVLAETTKTFTIDGYVVYINTFTIDGIVSARTDKTFTVDGIVLAETTKTFTIDGEVRQVLFETFTIDGIIKATSTNTFTIDAVVGPIPYLLGDIFLPTPKTLKRVSIFQKTDVINLAGGHGRDTGPRKEKYLLGWENLTVAEVDEIMTQVELETPLEFRVDDGNLQISGRNVIARPGARSYQTLGGDYLEHFGIELIVEEE